MRHPVASHSSFRGVWLATVLFPAAWISSVAAQAQPELPATGVEPEARDIAEVPYDVAVARALAAHTARDFVTAHRYMDHAHRLQPSARTLRGLGIIAHSEGDHVTAVLRLQAALQATEKALTGELRATVEELLADSYRHVGRYEVVGEGTGDLRVDGQAPALDGSGRIVLSVGAHAVTRTSDDPSQVYELATRGGELEQLRLPRQLAPAVPQPLPPAAATQPIPFRRSRCLPQSRTGPRRPRPSGCSYGHPRGVRCRCSSVGWPSLAPALPCLSSLTSGTTRSREHVKSSRAAAVLIRKNVSEAQRNVSFRSPERPVPWLCSVRWRSQPASLIGGEVSALEPRASPQVSPSTFKVPR
jgi:hypothetical protein